jgi:hypothetical protein
LLQKQVVDVLKEECIVGMKLERTHNKRRVVEERTKQKWKMKGHEKPWETEANSSREIKQSTEVIARELAEPDKRRDIAR